MTGVATEYTIEVNDEPDFSGTSVFLIPIGGKGDTLARLLTLKQQSHGVHQHYRIVQRLVTTGPWEEVQE
jgi:hypothetical protein